MDDKTPKQTDAEGIKVKIGASSTPASSTVAKNSTATKPKDGKDPKPDKKKRLTKAQKITIGAISVVLVLGLAASGYHFYQVTHKKVEPAQPQQVVVAQEEPKSDLVESPLSGEMVTKEEATQPVVASVVENLYPAARPQAGLSSAGVVYETLAEGGITRYLALFQAHYPKDVGPVRSLRPFFIDWAKEYDAPVMHVGGSALALSLVGPKALKDLNQFRYGTYFRRITTRSAPHNVYITSDMITKLLAVSKFNIAPAFSPWPRQDDAKVDTPTASTINVGLSTPAYQSKYIFNPDSDDYGRLLAGVADIDSNTNKQIKVKNLVVEFTTVNYKVLADHKLNTLTTTTGSGKVLIFRDGTVISGTWKKDNTNSRTTFVDASGAEIKLNRGLTWISVVPTGTAVTYK